MSPFWGNFHTDIGVTLKRVSVIIIGDSYLNALKFRFFISVFMESAEVYFDVHTIYIGTYLCHDISNIISRYRILSIGLNSYCGQSNCKNVERFNEAD